MRSRQRHGGCCALSSLLDPIERDVVLLKLLHEADERALRARQRRQGIERRADKDGHALLGVLVLEVLQCELRRRGRDRSRFGAQFGRSGRALWCAIMIYIYTWIIICYHGYGLNEMGLVVN